jgi:hypothetical protein
MPQDGYVHDILHLRFPENVAAPSQSKRASHSTTDRFVIIRIVVAVVCFVGLIGAACFIWRKRRWAKSKGLVAVGCTELDTTYAGEEVKYSRVSELDDTSIAALTYLNPYELVFSGSRQLVTNSGDIDT